MGKNKKGEDMTGAITPGLIEKRGGGGSIKMGVGLDKNTELFWGLNLGGGAWRRKVQCLVQGE